MDQHGHNHFTSLMPRTEILKVETHRQVRRTELVPVEHVLPFSVSGRRLRNFFHKFNESGVPIRLGLEWQVPDESTRHSLQSFQPAAREPDAESAIPPLSHATQRRLPD